MYNIGIDLGGTNIKVGVVDEKYRIVGKSNVKTDLPRPFEDIINSICKATELACENAGITLEMIDNIGIGTPGVAERNTGKVLYSNNLGFKNAELGKTLKQKLGRNVYIENDANAAAYGEYLNGGGKGYENIIVVTLGTGVGGGIIIDGKIYTGFNCCGAEIGHMVIEYNGVQCTCGRKGCFETYSSATGLIRMTREAMENDKTSEMWRIAGKLENVDGKTAFDGMKAGDRAASETVEKYIDYLSCGLTNIVNIFQPEVLLIGGGICREGESLIKPLEEKVNSESYCVNPERSTRIDVCKLGNDAGIIGAAYLYRL